MGQQQQEVRRAAAEAFIESLEQLQQTFAPEDKTAIPTIDQYEPDQPEDLADQSSNHTLSDFDLSSFEEAIADLEQFIEQRSDSAQ